VPFFERWLSSLRGADDRVVSSAGVLVRPHPANSRQWRAFDAPSFPDVALWPPIGTDFNDPNFRRDFFDSLFHSAAVVGINTSALLEAGIVGRPVFTITAPEFAHAQEGTLHFQHLVNPEGGLVRSAASLDAHILQLEAALHGRTRVSEADREFVRSFIRPSGLDRPAAPVFAGAVERLAAMPRPAAEADSWPLRSARVLVRPLAWLARSLAEDRPLWVYAARPVMATAVWTWASAAAARDVVRDVLRPGLKRARRRLHRVRYELTESTRRRARRVNKVISRHVRGLAGRVVRRQL
jgi:hypothetical protein